MTGLGTKTAYARLRIDEVKTQNMLKISVDYSLNAYNIILFCMCYQIQVFPETDQLNVTEKPPLRRKGG